MTDDQMSDEDVADVASAGDATGADHVEDPAPGDVHGVGVTATHAAPGTAEEAAPVQGVRTPSGS